MGRLWDRMPARYLKTRQKIFDRRTGGHCGRYSIPFRTRRDLCQYHNLNRVQTDNCAYFKIEWYKYNYRILPDTKKGGDVLFDWAVFLKIVIAVLQAILQNLPPM